MKVLETVKNRGSQPKDFPPKMSLSKGDCSLTVNSLERDLGLGYTPRPQPVALLCSAHTPALVSRAGFTGASPSWD